MKKLKKAICIILSAAMLAVTLGGCAQSTPAPTPAPTPSPSATSVADQKTTINGFNSDLYTANTVMFKADGAPVFWPEYLYWLASDISYIDKNVGYYPTDWTSKLTDTMTIKDYVINASNNAITMYRAVDKKAADMGIELSDQDKAEINGDIQSGIAAYETKEAFAAYLKSSYLTEDMYRYMLGVSILYKKMFANMYGANAEKFSDADTVSYATSQGYMKVKHIFMPSSTDPDTDNDTMTKMQSLLDQLKAAGSDDARAKLFDQLMTANSQDTGLAEYPNGYVFKDGDMDPDFQSASAALAVGGMSDIVKSSYGYHIILRLPLSPDDSVFSPDGSADDGTDTLRYYSAYASFQTIVDGWTKDVKIETTDALKNLDFSKIYK